MHSKISTIRSYVATMNACFVVLCGHTIARQDVYLTAYRHSYVAYEQYEVIKQ